MKVFRWLGIIASIFSAVMLTKHGFDVGSFVAPLQLMLDWYEAFMRFLWGWTEPYLHFALVRLFAWTHWSLQLHPHWRYIFVLMGIYLIKDETQLMTTRGLEARLVFHSLRGAFEVTKSALRLIPCLFIVLAASVCAGTVPLAEGDLTANFVVAAVVILGVVLNHFVYHFGVPVRGRFGREMYMPLIGAWTTLRKGWAQDIGETAVRALTRGALGVVTVALALQVPWVQQQQSPALAVLAFLVIARALYWFGQAHWFRSGELKRLKERGDRDGFQESLFYSVFPPNIPGSLSFDTLSIFVGAGLFVAANAGLKLLGL